MKIYQNIIGLIGNTPLVELTNYQKLQKLNARLVAKLECKNPAASVKDRVALSMMEDAEAKGVLKPDSVIVEPTSGNTGIGLAAIGAAKGYRVILTMPQTMSIERQKLLKLLGAEIILTEGAKGMAGAIAEAQKIAAQNPRAVILGQFTNPANPAAHFRTTGEEIWNDTDGQVDILVAGVGTGGTVSGAGSFLKSKNPKIKVVAVEPAQSPVLSGGRAGAHKLQGIGAGFIPATLDTAVYDEVYGVENEEALKAVRELAKTDGILIGISSGAALTAAAHIAARPENSGKLIVVIFPDSAERYLSMPE